MDQDDTQHNLDAEQAILGTLLFNNDALDEVTARLSADHFYDPVHARIFETTSGLIAKGGLADPVTLKQYFEQDEGLQEIGGVNYLAALASTWVPNESIPAYAELVRDHADKRALSQLFRGLDRQLEDATAKTVIEDCERQLAELTEVQEGEAEYTAGEALRAALDDPDVYVPVGLEDLDEARVLAPGLTFIAGRSSMGKSALSLACVYYAAKRGFAGLVLTNEMTAKQISMRWAAMETGIPYSWMKRGRLNNTDREKVVEALERIDALPLTIVESFGLGVAGLRARIRRWKRAQQKAERKLGIVCIDYLQNIAHAGRGSLYEETSRICGDLQTMQLTFQLPIIVSSQISRAAESEKDKRPSLRHLRDSGKIEEVADVVMLMYREAYYAEREPEKADPAEEMERMTRAQSRRVSVDVAKNRHGELSRFDLIGKLSTNSFEDWD